MINKVLRSQGSNRNSVSADKISILNFCVIIVPLTIDTQLDIEVLSP